MPRKVATGRKGASAARWLSASLPPRTRSTCALRPDRPKERTLSSSRRRRKSLPRWSPRSTSSGTTPRGRRTPDRWRPGGAAATPQARGPRLHGNVRAHALQVLGNVSKRGLQRFVHTDRVDRIVEVHDTVGKSRASRDARREL